MEQCLIVNYWPMSKNKFQSLVWGPRIVLIFVILLCLFFYECHQLTIASFVTIKSITVVKIISGKQTHGFQEDMTAHAANWRGVLDSTLQKCNWTEIGGAGTGYQDNDWYFKKSWPSYFFLLVFSTKMKKFQC